MRLQSIRNLATGIRDEGIQKAATFLLRNSSIRYLTYPEGPIKTALILGFANIRPINPARTKIDRQAYLFLQRQSGMILGLHLAGELDRVLTRFPEIPCRFQDWPQDECAFRTLEEEFSREFPACSIRFFRHAPAYPDTEFCQMMNVNYGLGQWKRLISKQEIYLSEAANEACHRFFDALFSPNDPAILAFRNGLNQEVLDTTASVGMRFGRNGNQLSAYNWLIVDDSIQCRNRKQAINELMWLVPMLTGMRFSPWMPQRLSETDDSLERWKSVRQEITQAIDSGQPLFSLAARLLKIPRETIAWCRYRALPEIGIIKASHVDSLLRVLSWIPKERRPQCLEDWRELEMQCSTFIRLLSAAHQLPDFLIVHARSESKVGNGMAAPEIERILARWLYQRSRIKSSEGHRKGRLDEELNRADRFLSALAEALNGHLRESEDARAVLSAHYKIICAWLESSTLHEIASLSAEWHKSIDQFVLTANSIGCQRKASWPMLSDGPLYFGNCIVVELASEQELSEEGQWMMHCVGNYAKACRAGESSIFSIRSRSGERLSTLELILNAPSMRLEIKSHKGFRNCTPADACQQAAAALLKTLNGRTYRAAREALKYQVEGQQSMVCEDQSNHAAEIAWSIIQTSNSARRLRAELGSRKENT